MSFRKRLFVSNLKVAFLPIICFVVLIISFLGVYRHYYLSESQNEEWADEMVTQAKNEIHTDKVNRESDRSDFEIRTIEDTNSDAKIIVVMAKHSPMSQFVASDKTLMWIILPFLVLVVLLIIWLCSNYSKRLTQQLMKPILQLGEGADRIQQGNLDVRLEYNSMDEFKAVFDSFNNMQSRLKDSILLSLDREKKRQEMVAEISHDLKTPLTVVKGYVRGLEDGVADTPEKQQHYLRKIRKKTDDMTHLIDEILMYSKLERGKIIFHNETVACDSYLKEVLHIMQEEYTEHVLLLHLDLNAPGAWIQIDSIQFNRVLENIISNSNKYSGNQVTEIWITTRIEADDVRIIFLDNGPGVPEEKLSHIFETFYRADDARNHPTEGSGLGLAICSHIVQKLSGCIEAYNDHGLCIKITLPITKKREKEKAI